MRPRETILYVLLMLISAVVIFGVFAYAQLEEIKGTYIIAEDTRTTNTIILEKYSAYITKDDLSHNSIFPFRYKTSKGDILNIEFIDLVKGVFTDTYFLLTLLVMVVNTMFLYYNIVYKRNTELKQKKFIETRLQLQTTMILTENLHHELNTPLAVISAKLKKMRNKMIEVYNTNIIDECELDYKATDASLTMIKDILDRLKSVKHLKVYESHRTFYEIIKSACEMIKISIPEQFDYSIDEELKKYKINSSLMKNGEVTGILLNHIKNSVEADASKVTFTSGGIDGFNRCVMFLGDNGKGIPKNIVSEIFNENFSSKTGIRGNGLYINKFLIQKATGDLSVVNSTSEGTAFKIVFPSLVASLEEQKNADNLDYDIVKQLETDIINKDILFQQFIDSLPDMAWLKDKEGKYVIANKAIKEGLLFDDNPIGKKDLELALKAKELFGSENHTFGDYPCADSDRITIERNAPSRFLESGLLKGKEVYLEVFKNVIRDHRGNIVGVCGTGRDLTEYMEAIYSFNETCGNCVRNPNFEAFNKYIFKDSKST